MDYRPKTCCSVRNCQNTIWSVKKSAEKITFHRFPLKNSRQTNLWIKFCDRKLWIPDDSSVVCSKHFTRDSYSLAYSDMETINIGKVRLKDDAVPTIFQSNKPKDDQLPVEERKSIIQELLSHHTSEETPTKHTRGKEDQTSHSDLEAPDIEPKFIEVETHTEKIQTFGELLNLVAHKKDCLKSWNVISQPNGVCFYKLTVDQTFTDVKFLVKIIVDKTLKVTVFFRDFQISAVEAGITKLESWDTFESILMRFERTWEVELNSRFHIQKALTHLFKVEDKEFFRKFRKEILMAREKLNDIVIHSDYKKFGSEEDVTLYEQIVEESGKDEFEVEEYEVLERESEILESAIEAEDVEMDYIVDESDLIEVIVNESSVETDREFCTTNCSDCGIEILHQDQSTLHICETSTAAKVPGNHTYICDLCGKSVANIKKLKLHLKDHRFRKPATCPYCQKLLSRATLRRHIEQVHKKLTYFCDKCGKEFKRAYLRNNHQDLCDGVYHKKYTWKKKMYTDPFYYNCTVNDCNEKYLSKISLQRHCKKVHNVQCNVEKTCFVCGEEFESQSLYFVHCRKHYKFTCPVCSKKFKTQEAFNKHQSTHDPNENRPFKCDQCEGSYKSLVHLSSHKKLQHSTDRSFNCLSCERRFPNLTRLNAHIKLVHEKTNLLHKCIYCENVRFSDVNGLRGHVKIQHKTDLIFECSDCKKKFKYLSEMRNHRDHVHGPKTATRRQDDVYLETPFHGHEDFDEEIEYLDTEN